MESISSTGLKESRISGPISTAIAAWGWPPICPVEGAGDVEPSLERRKGHLWLGPPVTCPTKRQSAAAIQYAGWEFTCANESVAAIDDSIVTSIASTASQNSTVGSL